MYSLDHHDWRVFLPFAIDRYKYNKATVTSEGVSFWYRPTPKRACGPGGTTGNTVSQLQMEFEPYDIIDDSVFFTVLATESVKITVSIGGVQSQGVLRDLPDGGVGLYHGSAPFNGRTGDVKITVRRKDVLVADESGPAIQNDCHNGMSGFDAWAGGRLTSKAPRPLDTPSLEDEACTRGTGANEFDVLCRATCSMGYCPKSACVCRATGAQTKLPPEVPGEVFPAEGLNSNYIGLCNYACLYGACFASYCGKTKYPLIEPIVSPFNPPSCTSGSGDGDWSVLCNFACHHGFCPIAKCKCTSQGPLSLLNPTRVTKTACDAGDGDQQEQTDPPVEQVEMPHLDRDCYRFPDSEKCTSDETEIARASELEGKCGLGTINNRYCCKGDPPPLSNCHWVGQGDCADNTCNNKEVTLILDRGGLDGTLCNWWRKKSLCCTPEEDALGNNGQCPAPYCTSETEEGCGPDEWGSSLPNDECEDDDCEHDELRRDVIVAPQVVSLADVISEETTTLQAKDRRRKFDISMFNFLQIIVAMTIIAREYPGAGSLLDQPGASDNVFQQDAGCTNPDILVTKYDTKATKAQTGKWLDTEHNPDAGKSQTLYAPEDYFQDQFGSIGNRAPMVLCEKKLNNMKGKIIGFDDPVARNTMRDLRDGALTGDISDQDEFFRGIARAISVFVYLNHPDVLPTVQGNRQNLFNPARLLAMLVIEFTNLEYLVREFDDAWYEEAARRTRAWVSSEWNLCTFQGKAGGVAQEDGESL
ncbi:mutanase [Colletotrichum gloeosporioides Cg-14]|uniref:Mutanase n=1 Tax=Colletotrichum gloeosporioides (strain Cg-14) TaxID=1237896 RepID=T0KH58_COLGC|nr:mutanase [Colletotrichum gloeosporioides Cg-14]